MSTNNGVNMIMTPSDILQFREINKEKLAKGNLDDFTRNKLATIIDVSEQVLEQAFLNTVQVVASNNPKFSLPEYLGSDMFATKVLEAAKVDDTQTELFKEEPKTNVKEEIAVVIGEGYKEQIESVFKNLSMGVYTKVKNAINIAKANNKDYNLIIDELIELTGGPKGIVDKVLQTLDKKSTESVLFTFLKLRDLFGLTEEEASDFTLALVRKYHTCGFDYIANPIHEQVSSWYNNSELLSSLQKLYDNIGEDEKSRKDLIQHLVSIISPERKDIIAKRKAKYKEKAYPDTK